MSRYTEATKKKPRHHTLREKRKDLRKMERREDSISGRDRGPEEGKKEEGGE